MYEFQLEWEVTTTEEGKINKILSHIPKCNIIGRKELFLGDTFVYDKD